jgi:hypothetical protein
MPSALGIYLWWQRVAERRVGVWLLACGSGGSLVLILHLVL